MEIINMNAFWFGILSGEKNHCYANVWNKTTGDETEQLSLLFEGVKLLGFR